LSFIAGLILDVVTHARREVRRLAYLSVRGPPAPFGHPVTMPPSDEEDRVSWVAA